MAVNLPMDDLTALAQRIWGSFIGRCVHRFIRMEGFDRSLVLASQAFTALIPLLIVVAALAPSGGPELIGETIITKFGLTGTSADAVNQLFAVSGVAESTASVGSAILLLYSGVSFTRRMQKMYRAAWNQQKAGVRGNLFAALGLFVFVAEVLLVYWIMSLAKYLPLDWVVALPLSIVTGLVPWTSVPYLLMNRQVHWRRLLVGGALTATTMAIFSLATTLYMPDLIDQYTGQFGLFGVTIAIIGWMLGAAVIVVASTAIGAEFDGSRAPWAVSLKDRWRLRDPNLPAPASQHRRGAGSHGRRPAPPRAGAGDLVGDGHGSVGSHRAGSRDHRRRGRAHLSVGLAALRLRQRTDRSVAAPPHPRADLAETRARRARE